MNSALSGIPVPRRRRLAAVTGLFAVLFVAVALVGLFAAGDDTPVAVRVFAVLALLAAVVLGLISWGLWHSIRVDQGDISLDAAIEDAITAAGSAAVCGCGHDHDPDELHATDAGCEHDGDGSNCEHDCDTCVLAALRPSTSTPPRA